MENNQKRSHAHPYGSTLIPHEFGTTTKMTLPPLVPGAPSIIPGTIGVAGNKITNTGPAEQPPSSIAQLVDGFIEQLVERAAEKVVEKVFERFELIKQAVDGNERWQKRMADQAKQYQERYANGFQPYSADLGNPETAPQIPPGPNGASYGATVLSPDYVRAMAPAALPSNEGMPPGAGEAHQRLQTALLALGPDHRIIFQRSAPAPLSFLIGRTYTDDGAMSHPGVEWTAYAAEFHSDRFPVKAVLGRYMVVVDGRELGVNHARIAEISAELRATFEQEDRLVAARHVELNRISILALHREITTIEALQLGKKAQDAFDQAIETLRGSQKRLGDEKRALEASQGLTIDEIVAKVAESLS